MSTFTSYICTVSLIRRISLQVIRAGSYKGGVVKWRWWLQEAHHPTNQRNHVTPHGLKAPASRHTAASFPHRHTRTHGERSNASASGHTEQTTTTTRTTTTDDHHNKHAHSYSYSDNATLIVTAAGAVHWIYRINRYIHYQYKDSWQVGTPPVIGVERRADGKENSISTWTDTYVWRKKLIPNRTGKSDTQNEYQTTTTNATRNTARAQVGGGHPHWFKENATSTSTITTTTMTAITII